MNEKERFDYLMKDAVQGFTKHIGFEPISFEPGKAVSRIKIEKHHIQQDGIVHAGVVATLADHTAGYSAFTLVPEENAILTVEYKINFLKPAFGDYLECRSKVISSGKKLLITESEVFAINKANETLVAKALLTMASVPKNKIRRDG